MTEAEAIAFAKSVAEQEGWPWVEPIHVQFHHGRLGASRKYWHLMSNALKMGGNVNIRIDAETGAVLQKAFARR